MQSLRQEAHIEHCRAARGSLKVFRDEAALDKAHATAENLPAEGLSLRRLSRQEIINVEPALAPIAEQLADGLHYAIDEIGDAYRFCVQIAEHARRLGAQFRFGAQVSYLEVRAGHVTALVSGQERFVADRYVVAAGSYSTLLLQGIGLRLPVRPAKGYSITIERHHSQPELTIPMIDGHLHAAIVPLNGALRIAGMAEFAGYDLTTSQPRIDGLLAFVRQILPQTQFDPSLTRAWYGLRPMSVDGVPIIGGVPRISRTR